MTNTPPPVPAVVAGRALLAAAKASATPAHPFPVFESLDAPTIYTALHRDILTIPATLFYGFACGDSTGQQSIGLTITDTTTGVALFEILVANGDTQTVDLPSPALVGGLTLTWAAGVAAPAGCILWR